MLLKELNKDSTSTATSSMKTAMDDQLTSKFGSLRIVIQPEENFETTDGLEIRRSPRSPRLKALQEKQKNVFCVKQNPVKTPIQHKTVCPNNIKQQEYDTEINDIQETNNLNENKAIGSNVKFKNKDQFINYSKSPSDNNKKDIKGPCSSKSPEKTKILESNVLKISPQKNTLQQRENVTIDNGENSQCDIATMGYPSPSNENRVDDIGNSSGMETPEQYYTPLIKHSLRSSPRFKQKSDQRYFNYDVKFINDNVSESQNQLLNDKKCPRKLSTNENFNPCETENLSASTLKSLHQKERVLESNIDCRLNRETGTEYTHDSVSLPSESEIYHTPTSIEEKTEKKCNNKSIWSTPQIKSRHQKVRINIQTIPEVESEKLSDVSTSTPSKSSDVLPESPGIENLYPNEVSPSANEQSNSSIQAGYCSSEDVPSPETSNCSTSSISKFNVSFGKAKVYCFDRCFGIDTVPDEGDFALGMSQVAWETVECALDDNTEELTKSMQKLTIDQRRTLLEESCVSVELDDLDGAKSTYRSPEIADIRSAREQVGCRCRGACDPATCECALAEIECHVERAGWPCSCTRQRCKNPEGRRQYEQAKIKKVTRIKIMQTGGKIQREI